MQAMGLPDWVFPGTIALMALGLPVVAFTAMARYAAYQTASRSGSHRPSGSQWLGARGIWAAQYLNWRRIAVGGVTSLGGFGALVAGVMVTRQLGIGPAASLIGKGAIQEQERLLVTEFSSSGVDSSLAAAATIAARSGLMQSRTVSILSGDLVGQALSRMRQPQTTPISFALGRELAQREGLRVIVAGHVLKAGSGFDVGMRLVSADSGLELTSVHRLARNE
jgi:hypothetical protein